MNRKQNTHVYWRMFIFDTKLSKKEFEIYFTIDSNKIIIRNVKQQQKINYLQIF